MFCGAGMSSYRKNIVLLFFFERNCAGTGAFQLQVFILLSNILISLLYFIMLRALIVSTGVVLLSL